MNRYRKGGGPAPAKTPLMIAQTVLESFKPTKIGLPLPDLVTKICKRNNYSSKILTLHCTVTPVLLIFALGILSFREYFGSGVQCKPTKVKSLLNPEGKEDWNEFCFRQGLFYTRVQFPGLFSDQLYIKHTYYQWVYFLLLFQLLFFVFPSTLWKRLSASLMSVCEKPKNEKEEDARIESAADHVLIGDKFRRWFRFCELFCVLHLVLEILVVDSLLRGRFLKLGIILLNSTKLDEMVHPADERNSLYVNYGPLQDVFPIWADCMAVQTGQGGTNEVLSPTCFLPLNNVNAKIFIWMWFWFAFLLPATVMLLVWEFLSQLLPFFRFTTLKQAAPNANSEMLRRFAMHSGYFFVLNIYAQLLGPTEFVDLLYKVDSQYFQHVRGNCKPKERPPGQQSSTSSAPTWEEIEDARRPPGLRAAKRNMTLRQEQSATCKNQLEFV